MADLEDGLWACNKTRTQYPLNQPLTGEFVTGMVKGGGGNHWAIKGGNATAGGKLASLWDGPRPQGYWPMKKQGALVRL